jgi:Fic family protein
MIKYSYLKRHLAKATPIQWEIIKAHYHELWQRYDSQVAYYRDLLSRHLITVAYYRRVTKVHRLDLHSALRSMVRSVMA